MLKHYGRIVLACVNVSVSSVKGWGAMTPICVIITPGLDCVEGLFGSAGLCLVVSVLMRFNRHPWLLVSGVSGCTLSVMCL